MPFFGVSANIVGRSHCLQKLLNYPRTGLLNPDSSEHSGIDLVSVGNRLEHVPLRISPVNSSHVLFLPF